jgi:WhiB family transcriptional regulator, redox-sensing transcriptional regulator
MRGPWDFEDPRCKGIDTEIYYPPEAEQPRELPLLRSICGNCIHKDECAEWGIKNERYGIWGGLTQNQRTRIRTSRGIVIPFGEFSA